MLTITQPRNEVLDQIAVREETLTIGGMETESIVDGPGFRYTVFVQGCNFRCPGCHNAYLQTFAGGCSITVGEILDAVRDNPLLDGLTLSGGDPFTQARVCAVLAEEVHALGLSVMTYTGYTFEDLWFADNPDWRRLIMTTDILVDGPFIREQRNIDLRFRGSSNQRLIDVRRTFAAGKIIVLGEE
ncbi:radical SAM protein [Treponema primitia]|uniref:4Fe-4S single cluster domain-containing protein n=1 Tax=Treponema primitia TaxID=88058 RepID=UPI00398084F4